MMLATRHRAAKTVQTDGDVCETLAPPPAAFPTDLRDDLLRDAFETTTVEATPQQADAVVVPTSTRPLVGYLVGHLNASCEEGTMSSEGTHVHRQSFETSPPDYVEDIPPEYHQEHFEATSNVDLKDRKYEFANQEQTPGPSGRSYQPLQGEKRELELNAVARAIDRAYEAAPQLEDQRCEPPAADTKGKKALRKARSTESVNRLAGSSKWRGKQRDIEKERQREQELNHIWEKIERAHGNRIGEQSYELDNSCHAFKERQREERFYTQLVDQSSSGRFSDQDAPSLLDTTNGTPHRVEADRQSEELLTLTDFVKEAGVRRSSAPTGRENVQPTQSARSENRISPSYDLRDYRRPRSSTNAADIASRPSPTTTGTFPRNTPTTALRRIINGAGFMRRNSQPEVDTSHQPPRTDEGSQRRERQRHSMGAGWD